MSHPENLKLWALPENRRSVGDAMLDEEWSQDAVSPKLSMNDDDHWSLTYLGFKSAGHFGLDWYLQCNLLGYELLKSVLEIDPHRHGGVPVLKGTRFTASQILAELAETEGVGELASNYDLNPKNVSEMLTGLSLILMRPLES